jgi:hypothetical protein
VRLSAAPALLAVLAITGCGAEPAGHDYANALARSIRVNGAQRIERTTAGPGHAARATVDEARCVQRAHTQHYSCQVKYTYHNSEGTYEYELRVSATCEPGGRCRWHAEGGGALVSAEPE